MVRVPERLPICAGVKVRLTVVFAPASDIEWRLSVVTANSAAFVPLIVSAEMCRVAVPLFVMVTELFAGRAHRLSQRR